LACLEDRPWVTLKDICRAVKAKDENIMRIILQNNPLVEINDNDQVTSKKRKDKPIQRKKRFTRV